VKKEWLGELKMAGDISFFVAHAPGFFRGDNNIKNQNAKVWIPAFVGMTRMKIAASLRSSQ